MEPLSGQQSRQRWGGVWTPPRSREKELLIDCASFPLSITCSPPLPFSFLPLFYPPVITPLHVPPRTCRPHLTSLRWVDSQQGDKQHPSTPSSAASFSCLSFILPSLILSFTPSIHPSVLAWLFSHCLSSLCVPSPSLPLLFLLPHSRSSIALITVWQSTAERWHQSLTTLWEHPPPKFFFSHLTPFLSKIISFSSRSPVPFYHRRHRRQTKWLHARDPHGCLFLLFADISFGPYSEACCGCAFERIIHRQVFKEHEN